MSKLEFAGPGLTIEQWEQISTLATSLKPGQALWLSGYFAGLNHSTQTSGDVVRSSPVSDLATAVPVAARTLTILYATETGNSAGLARTLAEAAREKGLDPVVSDVATYKTRKLKDEQDVLLIASTHGEGDPPQSAKSFFEFVEGRKAPKLPNLRFAVLALGDSTYEQYCGAGKRLDQRFEELGAQRIEARVDCDVDYEEIAPSWIAAIVNRLAPEPTLQPELAASTPAQVATPAAPAGTAYDKKNPFAATVIDNIVLTGRGSSKETRHIELSLAESGLLYEPGDALGIVAQNDPAVVDALLERLALPADAQVTVKQQTTGLREALTSAFEVTAATPRFIEHWADITGARELQGLRGTDQAEARTAFLRNNHVLDIVNQFAAPGIDAQTFVAGLRPLQPRLYSIASSLAASPEEAHLTVSTVRYDLNGLPRMGVASGHLAQRAEPDATLPVYIQTNSHFRLPEDDTPIIMIGAGTGVAPYRAFLQEREARGAQGRSWLVFGERNFRSDFLYQIEWQGYLKDGVLSRMDVAFSRDGAQKVYVQDRLREQGRDIYRWLEDGAHLYVCGDATHLAPDVHAALTEIVERHGGLDREAAHDYLGGLQRDHRYQLDVY
ncbi:MAG: assimilatory sulfite reductase (NADPH) flavoprotein subunit [Afipia sp.]|nr:assimilatory sulfite reductase (NADPH) flavoprotein subunit [Afipia sp.]OJW63257.1 MAG: sulfite reductase [NADPH] flavoprotein, alpha-component [Afipia sp. 64-13]